MLLSRVYRIFQRYADIHVAFDLPGGILHDGQGREIGSVSAVSVRDSRLRLTGHVQANSIALRINRTVQKLMLDVNPDQAAPARFALDVPLELGPIELTLETETGPVVQLVRGVQDRRLRLARAALGFKFLWILICLVPTIYIWKWRGDLGAREVVKQRLGLVPRPLSVPLSAAVFRPAPVQPAARMATLVMPVFNAFDLLAEALTRIEQHSGDNWRLVLVEDKSSDARVRPFIEAWAAAPEREGRVLLLCNAENLGFIGAVNRALEAAQRWPDDPVVLLNSDVNVPQGWLARLLAPLADPTVASVTPMANDAEIFTVPMLCQRGDIRPGTVDVIDAAAAQFDPQAALAEAPTGVGFCMALSPRFLAQVPRLDTIFGKGYGEETDWCQKVRALGGRHLGAGNIFVEHRGGTSFGSAAKQRLLEKNLGVISQRYPAYDAEVQSFIRHDPMATVRLALGMVWAGAQQDTAVPVYLAHALGGGAEMYLQNRIAEDLAAGGAAVVLRVGFMERWHIELHSAQGVTRGTTDDTDVMLAVMTHLPRRRIVYSCGVGDRDAIGLPDVLVQLADGGAQPLEVLVHDYFPISPSYTLLGSDGQYHGVPRVGAVFAQDRVHAAARPNGLPRATLADWQAAWGGLMRQAGRIIVFSEASRRIMAAAYPQAASALEVIPHRLSHIPPRIQRPAGRAVIGVLGNIGVQKGAAVLQTLSHDLARDGTGRLVVIGHLDPEYRLEPPSQVHGGYELRDLPGLVARYGISCWFIPSIWPETFSFTTHEALATGLPVFAFDVGAQGDTVARAVAAGAPGAVLPLPAADAPMKAASILLQRAMSEAVA